MKILAKLQQFFPITNQVTALVNRIKYQKQAGNWQGTGRSATPKFGLNWPCSPYLLVGHSAGGLYVNVFARIYPEEVAGVVLIDSTHPLQFEYFRKDQSILYAVFVTSTATGNTRYEASILRNIHAEFASIEPFPDIPLVVLTAENSSLFETAEMRNKWLEFQQDLASMSIYATHKVIAGSAHFIHKDKPQVVIAEITRIINEFKNIQ